MDKRHIIDLNNLEQNHCDEIDQMLSCISGNSTSTLWTAKMRPANRGGKPLGSPRIEEPLESDNQS